MKVLIPEQIYLAFERELTNNFTSKPVYGVRSQIITDLIVSWIDSRRDGG